MTPTGIYCRTPSGGGTGDEEGFDVAVGSDGVYLTGYTASFGEGGYDVFLVKYDSSGNQMWNTTWGASEG